jgi:hypothetical protein
MYQVRKVDQRSGTGSRAEGSDLGIAGTELTPSCKIESIIE